MQYPARDDTIAVILLGMHRSGTSCLAGSLQQAGLYLGDVSQWNPFNLKGNRENSRITALNDAVLGRSRGSWLSPPAALQWDQDHCREREEIFSELASGAVSAFGFKDPRSTLTLSFWRESGRRCRMVGTFRHPLLVARSLYSRDNMSSSQALELWLTYNRELLRHLAERPFPMVSFDVEPEEYLAAVGHVSGLLGLQGHAAAAACFFDQKLVSHKTPWRTRLAKEVEETYQQLTDIYRAQGIT